MTSVLWLHELLTNNDLVLSRTVKNAKIDTSVSSLKKRARVACEELIEAVTRNRLVVARFIIAQYPYRPTSSLEPTGALLALAFLTNDGINPNGLFRLWNYEPQVTPSVARVALNDIPRALSGVGEQIIEAYQLNSIQERLAIVAGIEWDIGIGPLHPFYDGCGRISRYFSALSSLWLGVPLVCHASREKYMARASEGRCVFIDYYLQQRRATGNLPDLC
jgi:hypothetical protein